MSTIKKTQGRKKHRSVSYAKYGYLFTAPFFICFLAFQLWPLITTFYYSFMRYYKRNAREFISYYGFNNFLNALGLNAGERAYFVQYLGNTLRIWIFNFIPQILLAMLLAAWLTNRSVNLRGKGAIKVMVYMPNIITAASVSVLFGALFSQFGPMTNLFRNLGLVAEGYDFMKSKWGTSGLISFILFWMWYGNSTLLLIAGMLGVNPGLYEAAEIDGANSRQKFFRITLPLLKPITLYVLITSAIGGLQMYDIPALFNVSFNGSFIGLPDDSSTTVAMYIMRLYSSDVGKAAAVSVMLFIITLIISLVLFASMREKNDSPLKDRRKAAGRV